jgi:hypothetical protein
MNQQTSALWTVRSRLFITSSFFRQYGLYVILMAFIFLGLLYDFTVPLFEKPDELKHFAVIQFIQTRGALPVVQAGLYRPWDQEGTQPPLYHGLAALLVALLPLDDFVEPERNPHYVDDRSFVWRERGNNNLYLHTPGEVWNTGPVFLAARMARWLSLLSGVGTISLTYLLARIIFVPEPDINRFGETEEGFSESENNRITKLYGWLPLLAAGLVAFIPQFLHVSTAITNDSLSVTLAAAALLLLSLILKRGGSTRYVMLLGAVLGLGALTKLSLLYLAPLAGLVLLYDFYRRRSLTQLLRFSLLIGGVMLLLAGWWYWRNWQFYGDVSALNAHLLYRGGALNPRPTLSQIWQTEMVGLELSFWAAFGAGQILWEPWLYEVLRWAKFLILLGAGLGFWRQLHPHFWPYKAGPECRASREPTSMLILVLLGLWTLIIFVALLRWMQITPASWGRLLYPTLPALGVLSAWGLLQFSFLIPNFNAPLSNHLRQIAALLPWLLLSFLLLLSIISPFHYLQAAYAKTPLVEETALPAEIQPLGFVYDDALRLIGYHLGKKAVRPGDWLPVTLYWQATRPLTLNYSAFVHLLDQNGRSIAQVNTYPDGGKWPTSMLQPGKVLEDTYYVPVPPETEAPLATRLALGIFEFEDSVRAAKVAVNPAGETAEPIVAGPPLLPHRWPVLAPPQTLEANFGNQIRLIGYNPINDKKIRPGETVSLSLYWETLQAPGQNLNLFIHLIDPTTGAQVAGFDGPPQFPTGFWQPGNTFIDTRALAFPPDLPPGDYELRIGWYNLINFSRLPLQDGGDSLLVSVVKVE